MYDVMYNMYDVMYGDDDVMYDVMCFHVYYVVMYDDDV